MSLSRLNTDRLIFVHNLVDDCVQCRRRTVREELGALLN